ncbi:ribosomal protein l35 domain-containing protein [Phthorimaea operculella]|nr:ribosomal protein l35 domain-containing protein [Phthorimaea operculella]
MFRCAFSVVRSIRPLSSSYFNAARIIYNDRKGFSTLNKVCCNGLPNVGVPSGSLSNNKQILDLSKNLSPVPVRTVTKFSLKKGKRKTVKAAVKRFFRLHWGGWIRPKVGRKKRLWTKSQNRKRRLRQHVFCNSTQSTLLDKMVTKFWKKPKHYVEDPYAPYHTREEFYNTQKRPLVRE